MRFYAPQFACPFSPHCPTGALFPFFQFSSAVIVVSVLRRQKLLLTFKRWLEHFQSAYGLNVTYLCAEAEGSSILISSSSESESLSCSADSWTQG